MAKKLYVGNLSFSTNEESLNQIFSQSGVVESVKIMTDPRSGRSKGFGFVEMTDDEAAQSAIHTLNETEYEGRTIRVSEAKPRTGSRP